MMSDWSKLLLSGKKWCSNNSRSVLWFAIGLEHIQALQYWNISVLIYLIYIYIHIYGIYTYIFIFQLKVHYADLEINCNQKRKIFDWLCLNKLNKYEWINKLTSKAKQFLTLLLCVCLADPATFLVSNSVPGTLCFQCHVEWQICY